MKSKNFGEIIVDAYKNFNNGNIDALLLLVIEDVFWPNGCEGGFVKGHSEVRDYWIRQWKSIDPKVEPVAFKVIDKDKYEVIVHQVVKDLAGKILLDELVKHIYQFEDGLVKNMEINEV